MKTYIIVSFIAIAALFSACKKTNTDQPQASGFYLQATLNGTTAWSDAYKANFQTGTDSVFVQGSGEFDLLQTKFKFDGAPGTYTLSADQWNYYWTFGEVIIRAKYYLRTDVPSTITVTSYDPSTKVIAGTFDLHLIKTQGTISTDPQNVDFTKGSFRVQLSQ